MKKIKQRQSIVGFNQAAFGAVGRLNRFSGKILPSCG